ncbi:MAG TPA: hypothetical protein VN231_06070 [Allosphingosinicella sp.]|nr:hypothetical protein [Allosphingosinicella sp.]
MGKRLGNDRRLWVKNAAGTTYYEVKGNQQLSISRSSATFSTGTKSDFPYDPQSPGTRALTLQGSFLPDLPDANGYERIIEVGRAGTIAALDLQVRKGGSAGADPADVEFECSMFVTQDDSTANQNAPYENNFTFVMAAAPTVDELK